MIAKLLLQNLIWVVVLGALLFVPAGTLHWPAAWLFLVTIGTLGIAGGLWLARHDPALLAERMRPMMQPDQPAADKTFMLVFGCAALIWFLAIGIDIREHGVRIPWGLQALGLAMLLFSSGFILWVMRENSFAAPVIRLQTERGHRMISTGPYAIVRHPMYSGTVLFFVGAPLLLGSWWGVATSPLLALLFAARIVIEERALTAGLPGYADYTTQVRYRLVPGLW
jgi:protein-S-isoprenylcysteine O-methyltransferase Ste14